MNTLSDRIPLENLRQSLQAVEPAALLIEPRILRRVIRLDRRLPGLGLLVPHRKVYTIDRGRLLAFADRSELGLSPADELPRSVILLAVPSDDEALEVVPAGESLHRFWRLLFHARVHLEVERRVAEYRSQEDFAIQRREQIGEVEFAEIRSVLLKDEFLFPEATELETYLEFAAVYLELRYFSEQDLPVYFPAIRDWQEIDRIIGQDVYHARLFQETRPAEAPLSLDAAPGSPAGEQQTPPAGQRPDPLVPSPPRFWRLQARAERASSVGNGVKAAILRSRAARLALPERRADVRTAAHAEMQRLVRRLQTVLRLSDSEAAEWDTALQPLLDHAAQGYWAGEARLLYDLQKVCIELERGVFRLRPFDWLRSLGRRPLRRPLPLLRDVLITKHLRTAERRVASARLSVPQRQRLAGLLAGAVGRVERESRDRIRPLIAHILDEVGLIPQNVPEQVSRRKLVEELLDRIVEHGYLNMSNLRDALSQNHLKLPDVSGPGALLQGDRLLRADHDLGRTLEGVYRPGAVYQRWPQRLSSLAFGTGYGRFVTQYVALPYGGAYLALAGILHAKDWFTGHPASPAGHEAAAAPGTGTASRALESTPDISGDTTGELAEALTAPPPGGIPAWTFYPAVLILGTLLLLLIHRPRFRAWCLDILWHSWRLLKTVVVDLPSDVFRSPLVQRLLHSQAFVAVERYLLRPALFTCTAALLALVTWGPWSLRLTLEVFLALNLFLNSPIGRYADERLTDILVRIWCDLRFRVFGAAFQWVMDTFQRLLAGLERILYSVDEWLRFRGGDRRSALIVKLVAGSIWFLVSYVTVFVFTLLVEPQINPIKHFPVVTVAHKLILPTGPIFVRRLTPYVGAARANTIVWSTIWLVPGVFGFLVWELKENWRLYAANRPRRLVPVPIGQHGETMAGLLRPGFHSGLLPKRFAHLRRVSRKSQRTGDGKPVNRQRAALQRVEEAVRRFVDRELCNLLNEARLLPEPQVVAGEVRLATNRVEVELERRDQPGSYLRLTWEEQAGRLSCAISRTGWLNSLSAEQRAVFAEALTGLVQKSGADHVHGLLAGRVTPPVLWDEWTQYWTQIPQPAEPAHRRTDPPAELEILPLPTATANLASRRQVDNR